MASEPADDAPAPAPPPRPMPIGLHGMAARSPLMRPRVGVVARRVAAFGRIVGVSGAVRRESIPGAGPALDVVRLPEGVWPMPHQDEDPLAAATAADPGMAAIARLYGRKRRERAEPVRRGLPSSTRRGARSASGMLTGPSAVARRLQPAEARVRRNESHGEATSQATSASPAPSRTSAPRSARSSPPVAASAGRTVTQAAAGYSRADRPDAKAVAFAAAMAAWDKSATSSGEHFRPPTAGVERSTGAAADEPVAARRPALWAAAAGRTGGFDEAADESDGGGDPVLRRRAGGELRVTAPRPPSGGGGARPGSPAAAAGSASPAVTAPVTGRSAPSDDLGGPVAVATRVTPQLHRSAFRSRPARPVATGATWRGGLPALHAAGPRPASPATVIGATHRAPATSSAPSILRRAIVRADDPARPPAGVPPRASLDHAGRVLRPGVVRRFVTAPAISPTTIDESAGRAVRRSSLPRIASAGVVRATTTTPGGAVRGPSGSIDRVAGSSGRRAARDAGLVGGRGASRVVAGRPAGPVRRAAAGTAAPSVPVEVSALDAPPVVIGARTLPLPLAARRTLLAAMQAGSTGEGSLADAAAAPVAPTQLPPPQGAVVAGEPMRAPEAGTVGVARSVMAAAAPGAGTAGPASARSGPAGIRSATTTARRSPLLPAASRAPRPASFAVRRAVDERAAATVPMLPAPAAGTDPQIVAMQERFVETLAASSNATPRPSAAAVRHRTAARPPVVPTAALPARFRPLTTAVVARRVRIAHGSASRAALRTVGRPAATLGNVVHLASAPDDSAATTELLAHELVHAATAPARPRFFAEPGRDAEERRANDVGRIARSARPDAQPAPVVRRVASAPVVPRVVQRVEATPPAPAPAPTPAVTPSPQQPDQVIRRVPGTAGGGEAEPTSEELNRLEDLILLLERRILNEMERRGGLARGGW
ncbi:MAG: DUF4157 domain-containing protein [Ilumatobacteraceae bacterium]